MTDTERLFAHLRSELINVGSSSFEEDYDVREIYGVFGDDHSFQFAFFEDKRIDGVTYHQLCNVFSPDAVITTFDNRKDVARILSNNDSIDAVLITSGYGSAIEDKYHLAHSYVFPFKRMDKPQIRENEASMARVVVKGSKLIPSHLLKNGMVSRQNIGKVHNAILSLAVKNGTMVERFLQSYGLIYKPNTLFPFINKVVMGAKPFAHQSREKNMGRMYALFGVNGTCEFVHETFEPSKENGNVYGLIRVIDDMPIVSGCKETKWREGSVFSIGGGYYFGVPASIIIPPELVSSKGIKLEDLYELEIKVENFINAHPGLMESYKDATREKEKAKNVDELRFYEEQIAKARAIKDEAAEVIWQSRYDDAVARNGKSIS